MRKVVFVWILLVIFPALGSGGQKRPPAGGLAADQIKVMHSISRAVLTARRNDPVNKEMKLLKEDFNNLRNRLLKLRRQLHTRKKIDAGIKEKTSRRSNMQSEAENAGLQSARAHVNQSLNMFKKRRMRLTAQAQDKRDRRKRMLLRATSKLQQLESDVEAMLDDSSDAQIQKLQKLLERMKPKQRVMGSPYHETPSISTIVRHRR